MFNRRQMYYAIEEERPETLEMMRLMDKHWIDHLTEVTSKLNNPAPDPAEIGPNSTNNLKTI